MKLIRMIIDGNEVARITEGEFREMPVNDTPVALNLENLYDQCFFGMDPLPDFEGRYELVQAGKYFPYQKASLRLEAIDVELPDMEEDDSKHGSDKGQFPSFFKDNEKKLEEYGIDYKDFQELSGSINQEIEDILRDIDPMGIFFESFSRSGGAKGKNDLRNLVWWKVGIDEKMLVSQFRGYDKILLSPIRILETDAKEAGIGNDKPFPNVDPSTGNIHVDFDLFKWVKDYKDNPSMALKQAVLVGSNDKRGIDPGPKSGCYNKTGEFKNDEVIIYSKDLRVPKKCYFPQLDDTVDKTYDLRALLYGLVKDIVEDEIMCQLKF